MSTVSFLLDKALSSHCFSQWLLAAFTFQIRCQSRRMNTAVNFADSLIFGSLNPKYSVLPGGCQKWRGTHFSRNQGHMTVISSQLLSVQGLFPKPGKIRSWQDQQTYILCLYWCNRKPNGQIPLLLREGWFCWGWWHLLRSVYLPNSRSHCSLVSSPCPSCWQKWPVLFWKKILLPGNTEEHPFAFFCTAFFLLFVFSPCYFELRLSAGAGLLCSLHQSHSLYLSPSQVFWAAFKKCGCNRRSKNEVTVWLHNWAEEWLSGCEQKKQPLLR